MVYGFRGLVTDFLASQRGHHISMHSTSTGKLLITMKQPRQLSLPRKKKAQRWLPTYTLRSWDRQGSIFLAILIRAHLKFWPSADDKIRLKSASECALIRLPPAPCPFHAVTSPKGSSTTWVWYSLTGNILLDATILQEFSEYRRSASCISIYVELENSNHTIYGVWEVSWLS